MKKPVVLGAGSCIVSILVEGLAALSGSLGRFEYVMSQDEPAGRKPVADDVLARCVLVIEEASPWRKYHALCDDERSKLPGTCEIVRVPTMHFNSLWPLMAADPRNIPEPLAPWGRFPFGRGDRLALSVIQTVPDPAKRLATYLATDIHSIVNVQRNHELELGDMFVRERGCDIQIAAYVAANFREKLLFFTHNHPSPELISFALIQLLAQPAVKALLDSPAVQCIEGAAAWIAHRNPFSGEESPIHPAVAKHFNLAWYSDAAIYHWLGVGYTFEEWVAYYLTYEAKALESPASN